MDAEQQLAQAHIGQPTVICANTHILFNPKRGDIKLGQVGCQTVLLGFTPSASLATSVAHSVTDVYAGADLVGACSRVAAASAQEVWTAQCRCYLRRLQHGGTQPNI
jgi:hypothetical protein